MAIIPLGNKTVANIYRCPVCSDYFVEQAGPVRVSCAVMHGSGTCCHYGERELTKAQVEQIKAILNTQKENDEPFSDSG